MNLTCTPYFDGNLPMLGENVAFSESSATAFVNSVVGARSNPESAQSALCSAIVGLTPRYGLLLDENRKAGVVVEVGDDIADEFDFSALGWAAAKKIGRDVPLFRGNFRATAEGLVNLGAELNTAGRVPLFHVEGATPEAAASGMTSIKLIEEPLLLACNKKHELAQRGEIELAETKDYPYQCLPPHENLHENLVNGCRKAGFEPEIAFCTEDSYAFFSGLGSGGCLTMVPEYTAFIEPQDGLALLRIRSPKCVRTLFIASHRGRELDEKCLAFQAFCFDFFRNMVENRSQRA